MAVSQPLLSVVFATRNGASVLPRTLEGYCRVVPAAGTWQLIAIDNGSTDDTAAIVTSFATRLPIELIHQPIPGKNRALNAGLSAVKGQLVVLTDDDAVPDRGFLSGWERMLYSHFDYELFGGRIAPHFDTAPPDWLALDGHLRAMMLAERNLAEGPIPADEIYGPNMAVRISVFRRGYRFDETIGPNGSDPYYPMGSETEFTRRIVRGGVQSWFTRFPLVHHIVQPRQMTKAALIARAYRNGRGQAHIGWEEGKTHSGPRVRLSDMLAIYSLDKVRRYRALGLYHKARGFKDEARRRRREGRRRARDDRLR